MYKSWRLIAIVITFFFLTYDLNFFANNLIFYKKI